MPAQLLPVQHYACSRALCSAYRLLEDYGNVKPGDTIIQNAADLPTGQAVIQLCKMLKIRTINLVPDDPSFNRTKELLMDLGATICTPPYLVSISSLPHFTISITWPKLDPSAHTVPHARE